MHSRQRRGTQETHQVSTELVDKVYMIDFSVPLAGLDRAAQSLEKTAVRIAQAGDPASDSIDLSAEMVALLEARTNFALNAQVVRSEAQVANSLIDILG
jgi:hypothetical protein